MSKFPASNFIMCNSYLHCYIQVLENQQLPSPFCEKPADSGNVSMDSSTSNSVASLAPATPEIVSQTRKEASDFLYSLYFKHLQQPIVDFCVHQKFFSAKCFILL